MKCRTKYLLRLIPAYFSALWENRKHHVLTQIWAFFLLTFDLAFKLIYGLATLLIAVVASFFWELGIIISKARKNLKHAVT